MAKVAHDPSSLIDGGETIRVRPVPDSSLHVNGGDGAYSYTRNSYYQRLAANVVKEKIHGAITMKLDVEKLSCRSNTICVADLGCAVGPNAFHAMQDILEFIKQKYKLQCPKSKMLEFLVFFNDQPSNDFNALFTSFPQERPYFAAGVPGSFHQRLFPESSIHFVHCSYALHWLSKLPQELLDKNSLAWNKGRVHYTNAPDEVVKAYASQFAKDMLDFLDARAKELAIGGMMIMIMPGMPDGMPYSQLAASLMYDFMASSFMDMANEGFISEDQVDSFNLPIYTPSPEEMTTLVARNGHFSIESLELTNPASLVDGAVDINAWVIHVRAAMEGMLTKHFTGDSIDEMFERLTQKLLKFSEQVESGYKERTQLLVVLIRK
ncbi:S-adenosyl-L-methionine-dependent methyltransferases superfamily protein, putative [Theobroma cacao]|uniref:S-adenosyl-L-methionine-dependent methyltransferases superfamily protein, putative n=1 Tax=Theobroma cacao TaxID=3641 RepID=A0A061EAF2_THECC|nr:S-adenosyl-L-methionine-dependent methyltransferases superfamily protein, putative [Theobroma cacao]